MRTRILPIFRGRQLNTEAIELAAELIRQGELAAFPTETVYGLGGDALNPDSARKIYAAKGRPSDNPLIVHVADWDSIPPIVRSIPPEARILAKRFWPGPMTLILEKSDLVPKETTGGLDTVAIRMPDHPGALALIRDAGGYIAAPSANRSGRPSPTLAEHVFEDLKDEGVLILDGGAALLGLESAIVDLTVTPPALLRPGVLTAEKLFGALEAGESHRGERDQSGGHDRNGDDDGGGGRDRNGDTDHGDDDRGGGCDRGDGLRDRNGDGDDFHPKAPGMKYRHYAPRGELRLLEPSPEMARELLALAERALSEGKEVGILCSNEVAEALYETEPDPRILIYRLGSRAYPAEIGASLFRGLRLMDTKEKTLILAEAYPREGVFAAVMNRLDKACGCSKKGKDL